MTRPILCCLVVALVALPSAALQDVPPGHPPIAPPQLPPGHPPAQVPQAPQAIPAERPAPKPEDVRSIDAIVGAYYNSLSGPAGRPRNWDRFRSLFSPSADLTTIKVSPAGATWFVLTPERYVEINDRYLERGGYFETELNRVTESFGNMAHVFSTFASRRRTDQDPYVRGINSMQLMYDGSRWWITSITWEHETPTNAVPPQYLTGA
jgi:hypothetical protein